MLSIDEEQLRIAIRNYSRADIDEERLKVIKMLILKELEINLFNLIREYAKVILGSR